MATDTRQRTTWGNRFRFLIRAVGLTGVVAVMAGGVIAAATLPGTNLATWSGWQSLADHLRDAASGWHGETARVGAWLLAGGVAAVAVALVVELLGVVFLAAGRRTAAGGAAAVGVAAAIFLLVAINVYSFTHYRRYDCTRDQRFTLPPHIADDMRKLRASAPTTIVVLQKHKTFGTLTDARDSYTSEAERKVTEKVKDLVDLFREFGPRFHVVVLDTEAFGYDRQLADLTRDAPELKAAIEAAPENSILFHANRRVQRLAFNEFMQLDKTASKQADGGRANLVLLPQGIDTFARRVLAVQERRPKVAVCVVHEWLTTAATEGTKQYTLAGLKKALTDNGFDVVDIVLKKNWNNERELEPAAYTLQESKLERLAAELRQARLAVRAANDDVKLLAQVREVAVEVRKRPWRDRAEFYTELGRGTQQREWTELLAAFRKWVTRGQPITEGNEDEFRAVLSAGLDAQARRAEEQVRDAERDQREADAKLQAAYADERALQDLRESDVKAKLGRLVADVDLLIVPRHTLANVPLASGVPPTIHTLDQKQVEVVREFMKAGKPVLACVGSISGPRGPRLEAVDGFERLLGERGIELGRDTVVFDSERRALAAARAGELIAGGASEVPPLLVVEVPPDVKAGPNPIASALRLTGRSVEQKLDLQLLALRPVYLAPGWQDRISFASEFVFTAPDAWNEEKPFLTADGAGRITYIPQYNPTPADDPKRNTRAEERRASFPVGVAVEGKVPAAWVNEDYERQQAVAALLLPHDGTLAAGLTVAAERLERPTQRTVVFGSGHLFSGPELEPAREKLLLHTVNWLTAREDRLPRAEATPWQYPRVEMSDRERTLWRAGTLFGLPMLAAYVGLIAMMFRRMR
jgi:hypothetical protein